MMLNCFLIIQENQHLWWTASEVANWSLAAQRQAGYMLDNPNIGHCNETDPLEFFRASNVKGWAQDGSDIRV